MLGGVVTLIVFVLPLILEKEKFGGAILCFLLPFLQPTIGHDSSATAATKSNHPSNKQKFSAGQRKTILKLAHHVTR